MEVRRPAASSVNILPLPDAGARELDDRLSAEHEPVLRQRVADPPDPRQLLELG
jgi:hypothetical protein